MNHTLKNMSVYAIPGIAQRKAILHPARITFQAIEHLVCQAMNAPKDRLQDRTKRREICFPRQVVMYFCVKHKNQLPENEGTLELLAAKYQLTHATAVHAFKAVANIIETNMTIASVCESIEWSIKEILYNNENSAASTRLHS